MELLTFTIAAAERKTFELPARYIEIIEASAALDLFLFSSSGHQVNDARGALSGLFIDEREMFARFDVRSATAQTITLLVTDGRGGSRRQPGIVRVVDDIGPGVTYASAGYLPAVTPFTAVQVLAPAANLAGVIIRGSSLQGQAGINGAINMQLVASRTTPTSFTAPAQRYVSSVAGSVGTGGANGPAFVVSDTRQNKLLPPGWGLFVCYEIVNAAAAASPAYFWNYEVL